MAGPLPTVCLSRLACLGTLDDICARHMDHMTCMIGLFLFGDGLLLEMFT